MKNHPNRIEPIDGSVYVYETCPDEGIVYVTIAGPDEDRPLIVMFDREDLAALNHARKALKRGMKAIDGRIAPEPTEHLLMDW